MDLWTEMLPAADEPILFSILQQAVARLNGAGISDGLVHQEKRTFHKMTQRDFGQNLIRKVVIFH